MTRTQTLDNLAGASAALVQEYDLTGMLVRTIFDAAESVDAAAGGLLVTNSAGDLELLAATSHAATSLETYQALSGEGPCEECVRQKASIALDIGEVGRRWPDIAGLMERSGYAFVLATPLLWRGTALGGLNLFWTGPPADPQESRVEAQLYSDLLTLFIVNAGPGEPGAARKRIDEALDARAVVEQAKGALAEQEGLDMQQAYERLLTLERDTGRSLSEVARDVVAAAGSGVRVADWI